MREREVKEGGNAVCERGERLALETCTPPCVPSCSMMTDEEKAKVKAIGKPALKDRKFLQAVADRTGVYIDHEVKDMIAVSTAHPWTS